METREYFSDFLIIGSGIAGLSFALKAAKYGSVNIVTKKTNSDSSTNYAQGGIATVFSPEDNFENHIKDTLISGAGLGNKKSIEILVKNGPDRVRELIEWGTHFTQKEKNGKQVLDLGREGAHSHNRIVHAKDLTGHEIERALLEKISETENIQIFENNTAIDLLTEHQLGKMDTDKVYKKDKINCYGAYILDNDSGVVNTFRSKIILLATGGVGQVYLHTTNPLIATGDGIAMAYRAGALISDMEFIQFHPTSLYTAKKTDRTFLISEAVRGEGAILLNHKNEKIMENIHPLKDLAPRDIVARAIDEELKKSGQECVYLDITFKGKDFLLKRFPHIYEQCLKEGIDISKEPIPVVPAAHYLCGGILSDTNGRTSIGNLYVSGESACTGVHGANRLASNSLLEGIVFSHNAFLDSSEKIKDIKDSDIPKYPEWNKEGTFDLEEWVLIQHNLLDVKRVMWDYVGIIRTDMRLERAYKRILMLADEIHNYFQKSTVSSHLIELRNLATVAKLIIKSARTRKDSVGLHFNTNHSEKCIIPKKVILKSKEEPKWVDLTDDISLKWDEYKK